MKYWNAEWQTLMLAVVALLRPARERVLCLVYWVLCLAVAFGTPLALDLANHLPGLSRSDNTRLVIVGLPALRLSGLYLALATFALAVAMPSLLKKLSHFTGGSQGINLFDQALKESSPTGDRYLVLLSTANVAKAARPGPPSSRMLHAIHPHRAPRAQAGTPRLTPIVSCTVAGAEV